MTDQETEDFWELVVHLADEISFDIDDAVAGKLEGQPPSVRQAVRDRLAETHRF